MADEHAADGVEPDIVDIEFSDPLAGLVEKTAADPGAPFAPEVLASLADLRKTDRAAFETLRAQLKRTGCRVTALDDALAEEVGVAPGGRGQTQADILLRLAQGADLFHVSDGTGYADLGINGHRETWPVRSKGFTRWLARSFFDGTNGAPNSEALQSALNVIEAKAHFDAIERPVFVRVASLDGRLYLDLCGPTWNGSRSAPAVGGSSTVRRCGFVAHRARSNYRFPSAAGQSPISSLFSTSAPIAISS
jgi:hypothetical protein